MLSGAMMSRATAVPDCPGPSDASLHAAKTTATAAATARINRAATRG